MRVRCRCIRLLGEVLDLYENDQRIQLTRRFATANPIVRADAGRLRQLLHNLLKNSIEAIGDTRKPHIEVGTSDIVENGQKWIELTIADNGPGLPEGFDERWYEPYTTSKAKGTGLGSGGREENRGRTRRQHPRRESPRRRRDIYAAFAARTVISRGQTSGVARTA